MTTKRRVGGVAGVGVLGAAIALGASLPGRAYGEEVPLGAVAMNVTGRGSQGPGDAFSQAGGTEETERAMLAGLDWLARHQMPEGHWSLQDFADRCKGDRCSGPGTIKADVAATGLALLAFLGSDQGQKPHLNYQQVMDKGIQWLVRGQKANGDLSTGAAVGGIMYPHGIAALALCEACAQRRDEALGKAAQKAVDFIEAAQHPKTGGWRYIPGQEGDTCVLGWQLSALVSARRAGLKVKPSSLEGASRWLDGVAQGPQHSRFSYVPQSAASPTMTAVGLISRRRLGVSPQDPMMAEGIKYLLETTPTADRRNVYYWYYATSALYAHGGEPWRTWNQDLRKRLVETQLSLGCAAGSWPPEGDTWGTTGGRVMLTAMSTTMLTVYHGRLALFKPKAE